MPCSEAAKISNRNYLDFLDSLWRRVFQFKLQQPPGPIQKNSPVDRQEFFIFYSGILDQF